MESRTKWIERKFNFSLNPNQLPVILEQLGNTHDILEGLTRDLPESILKIKIGGAWSILENIGHLADLDDLHHQRIRDFIAENTLLSPADMNNERTNHAGHNLKTLEQVLSEFKLKRDSFLEDFEKLDRHTQNFSSLHPRLQVSMKPVDMAAFVAEHDAHHIENIKEIITAGAVNNAL